MIGRCWSPEFKSQKAHQEATRRCIIFEEYNFENLEATLWATGIIGPHTHKQSSDNGRRSRSLGRMAETPHCIKVASICVKCHNVGPLASVMGV